MCVWITFQLFFKQNSVSHILSEGTLLCIIVLLLLCASLSVFARSDFERRRGSLRFGLEQFVSLRMAWHYGCPRKPWKYSDNSNIKWDTAAPLWHLHIWYCSLSNLINFRLYVKKKKLHFVFQLIHEYGKWILSTNENPTNFKDLKWQMANLQQSYNKQNVIVHWPGLHYSYRYLSWCKQAIWLQVH